MAQRKLNLENDPRLGHVVEEMLTVLVRRAQNTDICFRELEEAIGMADGVLSQDRAHCRFNQISFLRREAERHLSGMKLHQFPEAPDLALARMERDADRASRSEIILEQENANLKYDTIITCLNRHLVDQLENVHMAHYRAHILLKFASLNIRMGNLELAQLMADEVELILLEKELKTSPLHAKLKDLRSRFEW